MRIEQFIKKLQESDEATKRRWLIASTVIVMVIVIFVWFKYFNAIIQFGGGSASAAEAPHASFWETMGRGVANVAGAIMNGIRRLGGILAAPRTYIIRPTN
jgi:hypothetical protein